MTYLVFEGVYSDDCVVLITFEEWACELIILKGNSFTLFWVCKDALPLLFLPTHEYTVILDRVCFGQLLGLFSHSPLNKKGLSLESLQINVYYWTIFRVARYEVPTNRCNNDIHQIILGPSLQKMEFILIKDRTELSQRNHTLLISFPLIVAVHLQLCVESCCPSHRTIFVEFEYFNALILSPILRLIDFPYSNGVLL